VIRIGFVLNFRNNDWLGGINYYRNLIGAICENPETNLEPVIFTGYDSDKKILECFPEVSIVKSHIFDLYHASARVRHLLRMVLHRDIVLEYFLKKNGISLLSHSGSLGMKSHFPTTGWIPDFQHKYLPDFFSQNELSDRDKDFQTTCSECTRVIFSSNAAKSDAEKFYPEYAKKYRVLHFVTGTMDLSAMPDFASLKEKYLIKEPYFIVPNQFWVHKNHMVIIEALNLLTARGHPVTIIATGNTSDYRQPDYFGTLLKKIQDCHISENFKVIGIVPYKELIQLMTHAVAVINPSLFEGWSTSVEEAKALNLRVILSDIPVHREQNPKHGMFFPPHDPERLAGILLESLQSDKNAFGSEQLTRIFEKLKEQQKIFAINYERIVLDTLENPSESMKISHHVVPE
jgi:glycosyltransferase involved in cell wall biosynthesis